MTLHGHEVVTSRRVFEGRVASAHPDQVTMPDRGIAQREPLDRQGGRPVHWQRWEIPAGLEAAHIARSDGLAGLRPDDAP